MVSRWLKDSTNLMFQRQTTILSAAGVLMAMSLGSAILGLYKIHAFSALLSPENAILTGAFKAAFKLPDFIFQVVVAGALNAAFIPVYGELFARKKDDESWRLASSVMTATLIFFGILSVIVLIFAEPFVKIIIAPRFTGEKLELTAQLTRLMMVSPL